MKSGRCFSVLLALLLSVAVGVRGVDAQSSSTISSAELTFLTTVNGNFRARIAFDGGPGGNCEVALYGLIQNPDGTLSRSRLIATKEIKRGRTQVAISARRLPAVKFIDGDYPVAQMQARVTCDEAEDPVDSNVFARYIRCGSGGRLSASAWLAVLAATAG